MSIFSVKVQGNAAVYRVKLCKYPSIRPIRPDPTRSNPFTLRMNNGYNLTNPITFGSGVRPLNRPIRPPNPIKYYTKIHIFCPTRPQPDHIPPDPIRSDPIQRLLDRIRAQIFSIRPVRIKCRVTLNPTRPDP